MCWRGTAVICDGDRGNGRSAPSTRPTRLAGQKGEGKRPLLMQYLPLYTPEQARQHEVRPGITGWAGVNGRQTNNLLYNQPMAKLSDR